MIRGGQGRGPPPGARRHPRLPGRRLRAARPTLPRADPRMMSWLVCQDVPEEYVPMLLEEMELDGVDAREVAARRRRPSDRADFPVVVIGCGQSGLLAGIRLQEAGIPYTIIEKNAGVGGTWYENTLPRLPGRRRQPLLLLLVRARRPLEPVLRPAARAPGATSTTCMRRHGVDRARPLRDRGRAAPSGTRTPARWTVTRAGPTTAPRRTCRPSGHLRRRPAQPAQPARHPGPGRLRRAGLPLRPVGPLGRPRRASGWP